MTLENFTNNPQISFENIKTIDELLEKIKTPEELLEYMGKNIKYGYVGKENRKIYSPENKAFDNDFSKEYYLQAPEELLTSKRGVCWDQVELERQWFLKKNFDFKTYFLMFVKEEQNSLPTHTFLVYKNNNKFYWFENSFGSQRGIHEYENLDILIKDVKNKQFDYAKKSAGAVLDDFDNIKVYEYEVPEFGCNSNEFIDSIINNK